MVYKRYDSPFAQPVGSEQAVLPEKITQKEVFTPTRAEHQRRPAPPPNHNVVEKSGNFGFLSGLLSKIALDDILLLGLILIIFFDEKEEKDIPLLLALGFLFVIGFFE